ncbi:MAG: hypothetical protein GX295_09095 [Syntrophomonadaceae bacterium]|nr:hypothetical protein [Syntrophomonadaceae bacterium]
MKNKLVWFAMFLVVFLITGVAVQFFREGTINPVPVLAGGFGVAIALFLNIAPKKPVVLWIRVLLTTLGIPIVLVGVVLFVLSLFSIQPTGGIIFGIYVAGIIIILCLAKRFGAKCFLQDPVIDERILLHYAWSGSLSFIFLNFLIIGALLQPWIAFDQFGLWVGILIAGLLFWFATLVILEMKK